MESSTIILILVTVLAVRVGLHFWDKKNILLTAELKGWTNITVTWAPFAPGWFFEKGERHYEVTYTDKDGRYRESVCKTSMFTGIYWRDE